MGISLGTRSSEGWSDQQKMTLSIVPHVTGSLSIFGSAFIIYDVASNRQKWSSTYHRLLCAMGLVDFISSFATTLSTVPMPTESGDLSYGSTATCTLQGFFVHFNIASPLYNLALSIYFLLTVTFKWRKEDIKNKVEIWLHLIPFLWSFLTALVVLIQKGFHDSSLWCWINSAPIGCHNNPDEDCDLCPYCTEYYRWFFFFVPLWLAAAGTMVVMGILIYSVRKTEKKAAKWRPLTVLNQVEKEGTRKSARDGSIHWRSALEEELTAKPVKENSFHLRSAIEEEGTTKSLKEIEEEGKTKSAIDGSFHSRSVIDSSNHSFSTDAKESTTKESCCNHSRFPREALRNSKKFTTRLSTMASRLNPFDVDERRERKKASRMTRVVATQAFRYCVVFWITWAPGSANRILQLIHGYSYFWVMLLHVIFTPMQGLLNFVVYIDPRVRKWWNERKRERFRAKKNEERKRRERENGSVSRPASQRLVTNDDQDDQFDFDESMQRFLDSSNM